MSDNESLKALTVLLRASQTIEAQLRKDMQQFHINLTEFAVLELLYHKGNQPIQRIGEQILITSGSITYVVDKLEQKGYVCRDASPTDRRVTFAKLTKEGHAFIEEIFPIHQKLVEEIFSPINLQEKQQVIELLKKVGYHAKSL
ncbi:MAG: MarR family transcriptional regulator [Kurthia sp.]|nr:MarR family transcriptional regulator [Candidatus Kurthia equi]